MTVSHLSPLPSTGSGDRSPTADATSRRAPRRPVPPPTGRPERRDATADLLARADARPDELESRRLLGEVIRLNLEVAESVAHRFRGRGIPEEDLVQVACLGLVKAVQRFDGSCPRACGAVRPLETVAAGRWAAPTVAAAGRPLPPELLVSTAQRDLGLSSRDLEMLVHIGRGLSNDALAASCLLSVSSVKTCIRTGLRTIGVTRRTQAVLWAVDHDLVVLSGDESPTVVVTDVVTPLGRGLLAGVVGTLALDAATYLDMALTGRPASRVPEEAVRRAALAAGLDLPADDPRLPAYGAVGGLLTGSAVGVVASLLRERGPRLRSPVGAMAVGVLAMASTNLPLTLAGLTDPRAWSRSHWVRDVLPHLAFGVGVRAAMDAADRPRGFTWWRWRWVRPPHDPVPARSRPGQRADHTRG